MSWPGAIGPTSRIPGTFFTHEGLRLRTSIRLRWLAVAGQAFAVLWVYFGMGFALPIWLCTIFIALSAWVNISLSLSWSVDGAPARTLFVPAAGL